MQFEPLTPQGGPPSLWYSHPLLSPLGHVIEVPEEEIEKGDKNVFDEIMAENFPNVKKETYIQV